MKFLAWLGLSFLASLAIWFMYFGILFVYEDASGLKASLGAVHAGSQSIMPVWILVTAVINFIAVLYSAKFVDEVL